MEPIIKNEIRLDLVYGLIKENWKKFFLIGFITSVVTMALLFCIPRHYAVTVKLAPEFGESGGGGGALSSAASMIGLNLNGQGSDAITPEFYPDIVESTDFLVPIMEVKTVTSNGDFEGTYAEYVLKKEKFPWWIKLLGKAKMLIVKKPAPFNTSSDYKINPFMLTKAESDLMKRISTYIGCIVDEKTGVITLTFKAQDALVAANMANAVKEELQVFITKYRTEKNKVEYLHSAAMCDTAYVKYVKAQKEYAEYVDKHQGVSKQIYKIEEERLAGEMQMAFEIYNTLYQQKLLNEAEVQRRTPAFTVVQNASVPVKPASSMKLIKTAFMAILSALVYLIMLIAKEDDKNKKKSDVQTLENKG
ncbi:MAG: hypothetical protein J6U89_02965 [Bacteroidaceae bacterium]|nr:hypothetical protein [Bacteroidaceae bacterium]